MQWTRLLLPFFTVTRKDHFYAGSWYWRTSIRIVGLLEENVFKTIAIFWLSEIVHKSANQANFWSSPRGIFEEKDRLSRRVVNCFLRLVIRSRSRRGRRCWILPYNSKKAMTKKIESYRYSWLPNWHQICNNKKYRLFSRMAMWVCIKSPAFGSKNRLFIVAVSSPKALEKSFWIRKSLRFFLVKNAKKMYGVLERLVLRFYLNSLSWLIQKSNIWPIYYSLLQRMEIKSLKYQHSK